MMIQYDMTQASCIPTSISLPYCLIIKNSYSPTVKKMLCTCCRTQVPPEIGSNHSLTYPSRFLSKEFILFCHVRHIIVTFNIGWGGKPVNSNWDLRREFNFFLVKPQKISISLTLLVVILLTWITGASTLGMVFVNPFSKRKALSQSCMVPRTF